MHFEEEPRGRHSTVPDVEGARGLLHLGSVMQHEQCRRGLCAPKPRHGLTVLGLETALKSHGNL